MYFFHTVQFFVLYIYIYIYVCVCVCVCVCVVATKPLNTIQVNFILQKFETVFFKRRDEW